MDLFDYTDKKEEDSSKPLADKIRPKTVDDFVGQEHILSPGKLLYRAIQADRLSSIILYGPPGTGKTTLARVISNETDNAFEQLNAVTSGVKDIRRVVEEAMSRIKLEKRRTILFIDEIHRFNKSQQDALLPHVENGTIIIVGATTENPYFEVNKALISRTMVFELKPLEDRHIETILERALESKEYGYGDMNVDLSDRAKKHLIDVSNGDARIALNALELAVLSSKMDMEGNILVDLDIIQECVQKKAIRYEKNGDEHYDNVSAFIKSVRGSDPDAALYWLGKMLYGGEDPKFIGRRLIILASEDIGNADPNALNVAVSAFNGVNIVGMPEARIILAQATTYLASVPKSNSSYIAINKVMDDLEKRKIYPVPKNIADKPIGYVYPHNYEGAYVDQNYMPEDMKDRKYYDPTQNGFEREISNYLENLKKG